MIDDIADLIKDWPLPLRLLVAFVVTVILPAPVFAVSAQLIQKAQVPLTFPVNVFVWIYGGGLQHWLSDLARALGTLAVVAVAAVPVFLVAGWLWWSYGPGAMKRRKKARQEVWLNVHARQIQDKRMREVYEKAARAGLAADRDALERETRSESVV